MAAKKAARRSATRSRRPAAARPRKAVRRSAKPTATRKKTPARKKPARPVAKRAKPARRSKRPTRPVKRARRAARPTKPVKISPVKALKRPKLRPAPGPVRRLVKNVKVAPRPGGIGLPAQRSPGAPRVARPGQKPALDRERRLLPEAERAADAADSRLLSSARAGGNDLQHQLAEHTETSPSLTAGDIDANWADAYAIGDEAPGGDNPTPDQDRVDDIGKALGVTYAGDEELQGSEKIIERDRHRWELDPASSDDWPHGRD